MFRNRSRHVGIVVEILGSVKHFRVRMPNGDWVDIRYQAINFHIPQFAKWDKLRDYVPPGEAGESHMKWIETVASGKRPPQDIGENMDPTSAEMIYLKEFLNAEIAYIRDFVQGFLHSVVAEQISYLSRYQKMFNDLYRKDGEITIEKAQGYIFGKSSNIAQKYATFRMFYEDELHYKRRQNLQFVGQSSFIFRRKADVARIERVHSWVKHRSPQYQHFLNSCRKALEFFRDRKPILDDAVEKPTFDDNDRDFLISLTEFASVKSDMLFSPLTVIAAAVVKPLDKKVDEVDPLIDNIGWRYGDVNSGSTQLFLKDIGILPKWEDVDIYDADMNLPGHFSEEATLAMETANEEASKLLSKLKKPHSSSASSYLPSDEYERLRHDFGEMPVFVIDDVTASELDDGISFQRNPDGTVWIHVHVADPTSHLSPDDRISNYAKYRYQSVYLPERSYSMIPYDLSKEVFSLRPSKKGMNVLTFSAKLSAESGEILDILVRPGFIRNVLILNYDDVDKHLDWSAIVRRDFGNRRYIIGDAEVVHEQPSLLDEKKNGDHISALQMLQNILLKHSEKRVKLGMISVDVEQPTVQTIPYPLPIVKFDLKKPLYDLIGKEPGLNVGVDNCLHSPSRSMVAEAMVIAGEVCGLWASSRNLDVVYRAQKPPYDMPKELLDVIEQSKHPITGLLNPFAFESYRKYIQPAYHSITPVPHHGMGINGPYIKCTSPLRRYSDIFAHWQIKNALLGKKSLITDRNQFADEANKQLSRERLIQKGQLNLVKYWMLTFIRRIEDGELDQFGKSLAGKAWKARINFRDQSLKRPIVAVMIRDLGMLAYLPPDQVVQYLEVPHETILSVQILSVNPIDRILYARVIQE